VAGKKNLVFWAAAAALALPSIGLTLKRDAPPLADLLVVQIPAAAAPHSPDTTHLASPLDRYVDGARIVRVDAATGHAAVLTSDFVAACDPDVSFDGATIVFAGKRRARDSWQIWRMNADGSNKTQITRGPGRRLSPIYAGARFYLNDPQPTPQIVFVGSTPDSGSFALYGTDLEGDTLHRLTFNPQGDFSPDVLPTGRIVFSSWQRFGDRFAPDGLFTLMAVNIDGTDLMPFYGNHERPRYKDMPAVSQGGDRVYFVESDRLSWLGGGDLAYVSWRRPLHTYGTFPGDARDGGLFHSPAPLPDGGLLASYRDGSPGSEFALYRLDPESGRRLERVFAQAGWHSIDAHVLAPRPTAKGRSNWLRPGATTGVFYCLNCYRTNLGAEGSRSVAPPGTIRHVRVIAALPQRILGIAPVEEDGSFHIRVPAETPITFQLLDEDYVALRTQRAWTWVIGNENRGCIGCHDDPELSPPNRMVEAVVKPPVDLTVPSSRGRTVDFRHQIAPILASRCATAGCHVSGQAQPVLGGVGAEMSPSELHAIYRSLLESEADAPYVVPGEAGASPLIGLLLGRESSPRTVAGMHRGVLGQRDRIVFIEWVDLGAAWDSRPANDGSAP